MGGGYLNSSSHLHAADHRRDKEVECIKGKRDRCGDRRHARMDHLATRFFFVKTCTEIWNEARAALASDENQPGKEVRSNVARLAKVHLLRPYEDLSLIDQYAKAFSLDPDYVYDNTEFGSIMNFLIMWHKEDEYQARYTEIWNAMNANPAKK